MLPLPAWQSALWLGCLSAGSSDSHPAKPPQPLSDRSSRVSPAQHSMGQPERDSASGSAQMCDGGGRRASDSVENDSGDGLCEASVHRAIQCFCALALHHLLGEI